MIYYFSATGNSRHVANRLAESLGETVTSVMDVLHQEITVDDRMILVYPNYCGGVPSMIRTFLQKNVFHINENAKLMLVVTYGNNTGASASIATKYFQKNTGHAGSLGCLLLQRKHRRFLRRRPHGLQHHPPLLPQVGRRPVEAEQA